MHGLPGKPQLFIVNLGFPRRHLSGSLGAFLESLRYNLGMWVTWTTVLRRFFFPHSWKDSEFVCSDIERSPSLCVGKDHIV